MKKLLIALLTLLLLFSLTACGSDNNDPPPVDQQQQQQGQQGQQEQQEQQEQQQPDVKIDEALAETFLNTKTGKFYSQFANGKMYMEYKTSLEGMEMTVISASNGSKTYSETLIGGISSGASIIEGDVMYTLMPEMKMAYKMALG
ncbi:MAG: hypothetical protein IJC70_07505, partial [Firmicutes bacterium]|nr:hypothetical protein [Bacillota bacterium]